jgi:endoglucanase
MTVTPLSASGRWIVDANGQRVKLAGVNWPGAHEDDMVPSGLDYRDRNEIARQIAEWGFNSVRLTFAVRTLTVASQANPKLLAANPDLAGHTPWGVFQAVVQALTGQGLIVIPNCHMLFSGWCCSTADNNGLWYNDNWPVSRFEAAWQTIATAFAGNPLVAAYDIKNEPRNATIGGTVRTPTWGDGNTGTDFRLMYQQTGNLIHQHDPDALIICEGLSYAASLTGVPANPVRLTHPHKVIYSGQDYPWFGHAANQSQADYLSQMHTNLGRVMDPGSWQAPLWLGEFDVDNQSPSILDPGIPHGASSPHNAGTANRWHNVTAWLTQTDADWCYWHLGGTHVKGTEPVTNRLIYTKDDRCSSGVFAQDWQGSSSPYLLTALQKLQPASFGPGVG